MKFVNKCTGVILEPRSEMVAEQLAKSPEWKEYTKKAGKDKDNKSDEAGKADEAEK